MKTEREMSVIAAASPNALAVESHISLAWKISAQDSTTARVKSEPCSTETQSKGSD
jgi:hypothetical protein